MPQQMCDVMKAKGGPTKYLCVTIVLAVYFLMNSILHVLLKMSSHLSYKLPNWFMSHPFLYVKNVGPSVKKKKKHL